jgi:hypothetical protein
MSPATRHEGGILGRTEVLPVEWNAMSKEIKGTKLATGQESIGDFFSNGGNCLSKHAFILTMYINVMLLPRKS